MANIERSGWRDAAYAERVEAYSERHRRYGDDVPMIDLDGIVAGEDIIAGRWAETDRHQPVSLIEAKHVAVLDADGKLPSKIRNSEGAVVLRNLALMAGLPAFLVVYDPACWSYRVWPLTAPARHALYFCVPEAADREDGIELAESEWVGLLYAIRGRQVPSNVLEALK